MSDVDAILPFFPDWFRFDPAGASPIVAGAALLLCALYLRGVIWMWSQGRRWSVARTIAFVLGCALMFMVATFGVNRYASVSLTALMFQQITLMTVVPPLIIVGSPGRLLLHSTPHHGIGRIVLQQHTEVFVRGGARAPTSGHSHCDRTRAVPCTVPDGLHQYRHDDPSRCRPDPCRLPGRGLVAGVPLWSVDPLPRAPSYPARLIDILVELQIHAVLGLILIRSGAPLISAYATSQQGGDPVYDQAVAGMLLWTYAELPLFVVLIVCLSRWHSGDRRNARLNETREDAELEAYNTYLSEIDHKGGR
ncbi:cytochrome c oxidase assembly protein [Arthrobacter crystallopoietes]|uniref:cytochrome c oxidase assembly protein n=1 Tax=Crystallibacter crystallopoietes TaxID=37928 RepID=UPI0009F55D70|nr:cytochrome c oxidase assembly protein [Arthrobacter crystallopoietes]